MKNRINFQQELILMIINNLLKMKKFKSDLSTELQPNNQEEKYIESINQLISQNNYRKQALETAENLITNYIKENQSLKRQNKFLLQQIAFKSSQIQELRDESAKYKFQEEKNSDVKIRLKLMAERQENYEEKIRQLEAKLNLLTKQNKDTLKSKLLMRTQISDFSLNYNPERSKNLEKSLLQLKSIQLNNRKKAQDKFKLSQMRQKTEKNKLFDRPPSGQRSKTVCTMTPKKRTNEWK